MKLHLDVNQSKNCPRADHIMLLEHYRTPHYPLQGGSQGLQGISPLWPSLPGKAIKATFFCFTQTSVSVSIQHWRTEARILATLSSRKLFVILGCSLCFHLNPAGWIHPRDHLSVVNFSHSMISSYSILSPFNKM